MLFNQILNPRLTSPLVRLFGMKTGANPAPSLAPEVQPGLDVNQQDDPAQFFLRRSVIYGARNSVAAVAGQHSEMQLRNPAGSGLLLVIRGLAVQSTSTVSLGTRVTTSDYSTISTNGAFRDTRWLTLGSSAKAGILSGQTSAVPLFYSGGYIYASDNDVKPSNWVIAPGTSFNLLTNTANVDLFLSIEWEERPVAAEELQTG